MKSIRLERQSWKDVETYLASDNRIIMPVGSTEQHGAFAPLGTDTYVARAIAEGAAQAAGVLVAPPLWFGWSPHHLVKPGTISIRAEILIEVLCDAIGSLAGHGFKNFVVVNGHRIVNIPWMQIAAERVQRTLGVKVVLFDPPTCPRRWPPNWDSDPSAMGKRSKSRTCATATRTWCDWTRQKTTPKAKRHYTTLTRRTPGTPFATSLPLGKVCSKPSTIPVTPSPAAPARPHRKRAGPIMSIWLAAWLRSWKC
jgi:creatinine amidohydrolase/Fe(II)-dependent formamide hydrolase-like protein